MVAVWQRQVNRRKRKQRKLKRQRLKSINRKTRLSIKRSFCLVGVSFLKIRLWYFYFKTIVFRSSWNDALNAFTRRESISKWALKRRNQRAIANNQMFFSNSNSISNFSFFFSFNISVINLLVLIKIFLSNNRCSNKL